MRSPAGLRVSICIFCSNSTPQEVPKTPTKKEILAKKAGNIIKELGKIDNMEICDDGNKDSDFSVGDFLRLMEILIIFW